MTIVNDEMKERFLQFKLGGDYYGIPLVLVKEVIAPTEIRPVPEAPKHILGIVNLRGLVVSVVDLHKKFGMNNQKDSHETALIILDIPGISLSIRVDEVTSVVMPGLNELSGPPQIDERGSHAFVNGVLRKDGKMILLIDLGACLGLSMSAASSPSHESNHEFKAA